LKDGLENLNAAKKQSDQLVMLLASRRVEPQVCVYNCSFNSYYAYKCYFCCL